ncbi:MAG: hypothetical protein HQL54_12985 [Magnetococcales bacterium]|nr:hypothetical protein [Magnetococcales bacterium]
MSEVDQLASFQQSRAIQGQTETIQKGRQLAKDLENKSNARAADGAQEVAQKNKGFQQEAVKVSITANERSDSPAFSARPEQAQTYVRNQAI